MGRSQETFSKKEVRNRKEKKRKDKEVKMMARRENKKLGKPEETIVYVDDDGNLTSTPPDPTKKKEIKLEDIEIGTPKRDAAGQGDPVRKGVITFFNDDKGYGFVKDIETEESIFVHVNSVLGEFDEIKEGNKISFEVMMGPKGPAATQVRVEE